MLTLKRIEEVLYYDPEDGLLFWKPRGIPKWDARFAGTQAGTVKRDKKLNVEYLCVAIDRVKYRAHRLIWWMVTGVEPDCNIDHEDHDGLNNRFENLRLANHSENQKNLSKRRDNTSGITGVRRHRNKFIAAIQVGKTGIYLGIRDTIEEAAELRREAEIKYGFHKNHGKSIC